MTLEHEARQLDRYGHPEAAAAVRGYVALTERPELTPVEEWADRGIFLKREDYAGFTSLDMPSGAKVRQYRRMIAAQPPGLPLVVGCAAASAMQVYVAAAAVELGREAHVVVPRRNQPTASTRWAADHGAHIIESRVGYMNTLRAMARDRARELGGAVRWDMRLAAEDNAAQVENVDPPSGVVVVPTGSGLTAASVAAGFYRRRRPVTVLAVTVSPMASGDSMLALIDKFFDITPDELVGRHVDLRIVPPSSPYDRPVYAALPDGMNLDPFYAAKALPHVQEGDVLWVSGRRPESAS